ncbi:hypothetical protein P692DRAFT_201811305 [Suillus brevipes Sb2]|nr:hypothetical protein P692DRAFT_201811305 [Suillus brevipes Sb2]
MAHPTDWKSSLFCRPPTVDGMKELNALITCPQELTRITELEPRWTSALLSLQAHGSHNDGGHLETDNGFHAFTDLHYRTGFSKVQKATQDDRLNNWLTGGSTIVLHHPGATSPNADVVPESLKAEVYVNPRVLAEHQELHPVLAQITQTFIADYAAPLAHAFAETRSRKWGKSTPSKGNATPSKGKEKFDTILPLVPLPVSPNSAHFVFHGRPAGSLECLLNSSSHILSYAPSPYDGNVIWEPTQVQIRHACADYNKSGGSASVPSSSHPSSSHPSSSHPSSSRPSISQPSSLPPSISRPSRSYRVEQSSAGTETQKLVLRVNRPAKSLGAPVTFYETSDSDNNNDFNVFNSPQRYPPVTPTSTRSVKKAVSFVPPPSLITYSISEPQTSRVSTLVPFGMKTEAALEELGYPDAFHSICTSIRKQYLTKNWVTKLQELAGIPKLLCYSVRATHTTIMFGFRSHNSRRLVPRTRGPYVKVSKEVQQQLTERRRAKRLDEDHEIQLVLNYINAKATDLAVKFKQPRRRYLERFSLGSVVHHRKRHKTSIEANSSTDKKSNVSELVKKASDYHELTDQQKEELIIEFDKVKKGAQDRPPNITARTRAAECARSFQFVREELEALNLNKRVGAEAFVVMVRGVSDFAMAPKAFFTSPATEQFVRLYLRKDIAKMATDFESTVLANGLVINTASNHRERVAKAKTAIRIGLRASLCEVTEDPSATVEFTRYNDLVRDYHVKLVGWNHPQWANPSDLKGGIESLEKVASAIAEGTCKFVSITHEEVEERMNRIKNGEKLTPELEPPMPPDALPSASPPTTATPLPSASPPTTATPLPSASPPTTATPSTGPLPNSSHPSPSPLEHENDSGPSPFENENDSGPSPFEDDNSPVPTESTRISSITDDLVDPALRELGNSSTAPVERLPSQSDSTTPSQPPIPTPSQPQPRATASPLPANEDALVSVTNHNRKRPVDDMTPSEGQRPKRAHKLTEKAQQLCSLDSDSCETDKVQRRKAKGGQRAKKSRAVIESDQENTM